MVVLLASPQALLAKTVTIGTGSGMIEYFDAQNILDLDPGDTVYIASGSYLGVRLHNLAGTAADPIIVRADPNAVFTTTSKNFGSSFVNAAYLEIEDFRFETYASRCITIQGDSHDLVFRNFYLYDVSEYGFYIYDPNKVFDGTKASAFYNIKLEDCVFDYCSAMAITNEDWGGVSNLKSLLLDFEIDGCTFSHFDQNGQTYSIIDLIKCFGAKIHDCTFSDIGMLEGDWTPGHVALIGGSGTFEVYRNSFTRQWGSEVRVFPLKLNALGYENLVNRYYNNISWEKINYTMFEHYYLTPQSEIDNSNGYFSYQATEIFFNTLYRSRKGNYMAPMVEVYSPNCTIKHNLIIDPECDVPFDPNKNYVYNLSAGPQSNVVVENNHVYETFSQSGLIDAVDFVPDVTSPVRNAATGTVSYITTDFYGNDRYVDGVADIGAVEQPNGIPTVDVGCDLVVSLTYGADLDATVTDDDMPSIITLWTQESGPGTVTFGDDEAVDTTATFSAEGCYVLRLTAYDGELTAYDELTIDVGDAQAQGSVILADDFAGSGALNGSVPSSPQNPNDVWIDTASGWNRSPGGAVINSGGHAAQLPVSLASGHVYTLSADVTYTGNPGTEWLSLGFSNTTSTNPAWQAGNYGWILLKSAWNPRNDDLEAYAGSGAANQIGTATVADGTHELSIVLDTTGANWTVSTYVDSAQIGSTYTYGINPTITYIAISSSSSTAVGTIENLQLTTGNTTNSAPTVDAGSNDIVTMSTFGVATTNLNATVGDDGLPNPPATCTMLWTQESGPGTVVFGDNEAIDTTASFTVSGTYVLRLTGDDGDLTAYDEVTITVNDSPFILADDFSGSGALNGSTPSAPQNPGDVWIDGASGWSRSSGAAVINSGGHAAQLPVTITPGQVYTLSADITYTGSPSTEWLTLGFSNTTSTNPAWQAGNYAWILLKSSWNPAEDELEAFAGSGTANSIGTTTVADGTHELMIVLDTTGANWTVATYVDSVQIGSTYTYSTNPAITYVAISSSSGSAVGTVENLQLTAGTSSSNAAPNVNAGSDDAITLPIDTVSLNGTVTDDGLPDPPAAYTVLWTKTSGPGTVTFGDDGAVDTIAMFSDEGTYVLRLTADDGELDDYDEVTVTVYAGAAIILADDFSGSGVLNGSAPSNPQNPSDVWIDTASGWTRSSGEAVVNSGGHAAQLPVSIISGQVYTLSADVTYTGSPGTEWLSLGFSNTTSTNPAWQAGNYGWILLRSAWEPTEDDLEAFAGSGAANSIGTTTVTDGTHELMIVLDTTGTNWTVATYVDSAQIGSTYTYGTNPIINYVAITSSSGNAAGTVENLQLVVGGN